MLIAVADHESAHAHQTANATMIEVVITLEEIVMDEMTAMDVTGDHPQQPPILTDTYQARSLPCRLSILSRIQTP